MKIARSHSHNTLHSLLSTIKYDVKKKNRSVSKYILSHCQETQRFSHWTKSKIGIRDRQPCESCECFSSALFPQLLGAFAHFDTILADFSSPGNLSVASRAENRRQVEAPLIFDRISSIPKEAPKVTLSRETEGAGRATAGWLAPGREARGEAEPDGE
ncbi:hypothetical protein KM043_017220 [Ampulex compressa]|nr:hypothetical protein KM043_017220 [Ampulex compressa]